MGHSQADKAESRDRIVRAAAARVREAGAEGVGVAELMQQAGLTHGGFYRHFASRDDLLAEAIAHALHDGARAVDAVARLRRAPLAALVDAYLSPAHRDRLATSCAVTTLAADVARGGERAREAYTKQVGAYLELLTRLIDAGSPDAGRAKAVAALSALVGAVSLARAVNDPALSAEILATAARQVKAQLGCEPPDGIGATLSPLSGDKP